MKFLYIMAYGANIDLLWSLIDMGYTVNTVDSIIMNPNETVTEWNEPIINAINTHKPHYVISYLFIPQLSNITHQFGIPYISWTYDSPLIALFNNDAVFNDNNYIFIFDKAQYKRLKDNNCPHVYYMPMGVNLNRVGALDLTEDEEKELASDISFVGRLYLDNMYDKITPYLNTPTHIEINNYLISHTCNWTEASPWHALSDNAVNSLTTIFDKPTPYVHSISGNELWGLQLLPRKLAQMNRITVLNELAKRHTVDLYTTDECEHLKGVKLHPGVDYFSTMSKIFYCSKINLNITLPSIETGLPQRIFDIMGVGGFVLTNYQEDADEIFKTGHSIETFKTMDELFDKTDYYLNHEDARLRIAINGYKEVRDKHTIAHRVNEMLNIINSNK